MLLSQATHELAPNVSLAALLAFWCVAKGSTSFPEEPCGDRPKASAQTGSGGLSLRLEIQGIAGRWTSNERIGRSRFRPGSAAHGRKVAAAVAGMPLLITVSRPSVYSLPLRSPLPVPLASAARPKTLGTRPQCVGTDVDQALVPNAASRTGEP